MPIFLGVHKLPKEFKDREVRAGWRTYQKSARAMKLKPLSAVYSLTKRFAYCQTEAKTAQEVRRAHTKVEIPLEAVIEVERI